MNNVTVDEIDALLPQTQCRECGYAGCRPYAQALAEQSATIEHCAPGGITTLLALAKLLHEDPTPHLATVQAHTKLLHIASIREQECIGCTKCIQACPVDAIIGSAKQMHTILRAECTGCGLCVEPCPVDCIDLLTVPVLHYQPTQARNRFIARQQRLEHPQQKISAPPSINNTDNTALLAKKQAIQAAIARAKAKKAAL